jgi:hypothetical protein
MKTDNTLNYITIFIGITTLVFVYAGVKSIKEDIKNLK